MKKSLFALAALGAFAGAAQAQSSVTLFGTLDASVQYIQNGGVDKTGTTTNTAITSSTASPVTANCSVCFVDGAIATSMWGMKGTEDLGGGARAEFYAAGDMLVNNGTNHNSGMFRRGAYVLVGNDMGSVSLGLRSNPNTDAFAQALPVMGNSVTQVRNVIGFASGDFIKNQISYETPKLSGFQARVAYGTSNQMNDLSGGSVFAAGASFTGVKDLTLLAGYNKANAVNGGQEGDPAATASTTAVGAPPSSNSASAAWASLYDQTGYFAGAKYTMGAFSIGYAFAHGEITQYGAGTAATATAAGIAGSVTKSANANVNMVGVGYQATPTLLLGLNYLITTADSSLTNLQARYSLSKRTTAYFQAAMAKNGAGSASDGSAFGNFMPTNLNSSTYYKNAAGYGLVSGSSYTGGLPNTTASSFGLGLIHNF